MKNKNKTGRKDFVKTIGWGAFVLSMISLLPFKIFGRKNEKGKRVKVNIHPNAIKRNK